MHHHLNPETHRSVIKGKLCTLTVSLDRDKKNHKLVSTHEVK